MRNDGRNNETIRNIKITADFLKNSGGSVFWEMGNTRIICAATLIDGVPPFLRGTGKGWLTAEYAMLPASTATRLPREISVGRINGRSQEIQRLIGRALRSVVDLDRYGERTIYIDCDVLQADGGTRSASISGAFIALVLLFEKMIANMVIPSIPVSDYLAAISVGVVAGEVLLDLNYEEDGRAEVDANFVMTGNGGIVEVQATAEGSPFSNVIFEEMLKRARGGIEEIIALQRSIVGNVLL